MKRTLYTFIILSVITLCSMSSADNVNAQTKTTYTYTKPSWTISIGPVWNLATNDSYGRANYTFQEQVLKDNYGMRWGWGGYLVGKYSPGKTKVDRIFLGVDYKGMTNSDFDGGNEGANETQFNIVTIDAGYEYLFYGTNFFRSYYGAGLTGNFISGEYTPAANNTSLTNVAKSFDSQFRFGMELKAGLEFIFSSSKRNLGLNVGAKYNLMNLFTDDNALPTEGQTTNLNLNDGDGTGGPGFKRYLGMLSIDIGISIYPDVKKVARTY
ncbi:MAG TPA: hypothetical protein PKA90_01675 [Ignavibacteria bacterium]|nr:hypothetical protein [Ignavibacteria bacterium]HMR39116.1 hypothetical protein [Ignavibacteria bacterium]